MDWTALMGTLYLVAFGLAVAGVAWTNMNENNAGWDHKPTETFCHGAVSMIFLSGMVLAIRGVLGL